jgi:hypothetical protein
MGCKELIDIVLTGAMVFATWQIMNSNANQTKIANQKRKDDLFKIRWECYKKIVKFIRNINFPLEERLCSYYTEINKPKYSKDNILEKQSEVVLKLILTLHDILEGDKEILSQYENLYSNYFNSEIFFLKRRSLLLFNEDISKSLEQFLNPKNIIKAFQEHYKVLMQNKNIEIKDLKYHIQRHGWTTDHYERGLKNKIENLNYISDPSAINIYNFIADVIMISKPGSLIPKFTFNKNCMLPKELEKKFDKYLKLE